MKNINIVFAVHNHQPIGNFEKVFEEAYQQSYKPFLNVLERHPGIKFTQHYTGPLLEWLLQRHPEFIERMRAIVRRGQLELLTGAYYEAILAIIPEQDRVGQIRKLSDYIHKVFDYVPRGMWLAERVWEQSVVSSLAKAGVEYVTVDDTHFRHAGLGDEQLLGYYITEEQGAMVRVLPIDKMLRYTIPFRSIDETLRYLQQVATENGQRVVIHADDGEKFGVWPKTFKHVYEDGWLESLCRIFGTSEWIHTLHFSDVIDSFQAMGTVYLPTASYAEMMKWALNPTAFVKLETFEDQLQRGNLLEANRMFVRGGFWRNFLAKYPEANHMHKKMLRVASRAHKWEKKMNVSGEILDHVWAGQCNDPYWHGVFGGLYLPNLRFPVYQNLLIAEKKLDELEKQPLRVEHTDLDCDGVDELLIESSEMNLYLKPNSGGSLVELDFKPVPFNLLDIVSRREEGYHRRLLVDGKRYEHQEPVHDAVLVKEPGLDKHLHFDWYRHASLVDHFFGEDTTLESFAQCKYLERGDFVNQPYHVEVRKTRGMVTVRLKRDGALWFENMPHRITVGKELRYKPGTSKFTTDYVVTNAESKPVDIWFGIEFSVGLMAGDAHDRYYRIEDRNLRDQTLRSSGEEPDVRSCKLVDEWLGLEVEISVTEPCTLWRFPIETVSLSEAGFERVYQCSIVTPTWKLRLQKEFSVQVTQSVQELRKTPATPVSG